MRDLSVLKRCVTELNRVVDNIGADQLGDPTPCSEWVVRDVLNHVAAGGTMFAIGAELGSISDELVSKLFVTEDQLGDDYKAAVRSSSERTLAAFSMPGVFEKTLLLPMWHVPGHVAATVAVFDFTTHICDLARSTGQQVDDSELLWTALEYGRALDSPGLRVPGRLGPEQPMRPNASNMDALLAFAGRHLETPTR
jgi:uncharacterized protein (TIGR03086 family)